MTRLFGQFITQPHREQDHFSGRSVNGLAGLGPAGIDLVGHADGSVFGWHVTSAACRRSAGLEQELARVHVDRSMCGQLLLSQADHVPALHAGASHNLLADPTVLGGQSGTGPSQGQSPKVLMDHCSFVNTSAHRSRAYQQQFL